MGTDSAYSPRRMCISACLMPKAWILIWGSSSWIDWMMAGGIALETRVGLSLDAKSIGFIDLSVLSW